MRSTNVPICSLLFLPYKELDVGCAVKVSYFDCHFRFDDSCDISRKTPKFSRFLSPSRFRERLSAPGRTDDTDREQSAFGVIVQIGVGIFTVAAPEPHRSLP